MEGEERNNVENDGIATVRRIFVGGLGESVTADDIRKTFSSLGMVKDVDIVRTKGRSFAYMDFCPSSEQALSKLFSMYNGCVWKGGRLKLEMAKEHYIVRLKREWEEDEKLASITVSNEMDADKKMVPREKPKKFQKMEKKEIHMFFPKSRKIKALPLSGTGKHKYSFQRIEVPALPIHFCDCEEHFDPSHAVGGKNFCDLERQNGGMNDKEVNLMNSVMKKLFQKENNVQVASDGNEWTEEVDPIESYDDLPLDENEASQSEEDNLIINIVAKGNDVMALNNFKQEAFSIKQESKSLEQRNSKGKKIKNPPNKKRKSLPVEVKDKNAIEFPTPEKKGRLQSAEPKSGLMQSATCLSLSQKSSWKKLIDSSGTSQFSISQVLQGNASIEDKEQELDSQDVPNATNCEILSGGSASTEDEETELSRLDVPNDTGCNKGSGPTKDKEQESTTSSNAGSASTEDKGQELGSHDMPKATESKIRSAVMRKAPENLPKKMVELADAQSTKQNGVVSKSARGASWKQKSSWTQLVGDLSSSSFSISNIVTGVNPEKELTKPNSVDMVKSINKTHRDLDQNRNEPAGDCFRDFGLDKDGSTAVSRSSKKVNLDEHEQNISSMDWSRSSLAKDKISIIGNCDVSTSKVNQKHVTAAKQASPVDGGVGETCLFMRTDSSLKEWASVKAALSGSLKKKNNEK